MAGDTHDNRHWQFRAAKVDARGRRVRLYRNRTAYGSYKRVIECSPVFRGLRWIVVEYASKAPDGSLSPWRSIFKTQAEIRIENQK